MIGKGGEIDPAYYHVVSKENSINFKLFKFMSVPTDNTWIGQDWGQPQPGYIELC